MTKVAAWLRRWRADVTACGAGSLFALGLAISGMTLPAKVLGFLDFLGNWDPTLAFVMGGAVVTYFFGHKFVLKSRKTPVYGSNFDLPTKTTFDAKLISGALIFGVGWGLAGYCPGPAIAGTGAMKTEALMFYTAMAIGMFIYTGLIRRWRAK